MKRLTTGLLAFLCTSVFSVSALADPFPDGTYQAGYLKSWNIVTCPPIMTVIGTKIITDPGYDWKIIPHNFQNLVKPATDIPFVGAAMVKGEAKCFYKVSPKGSMDSPAVVLEDDHHYLQLGPYDKSVGTYSGACGMNAKDCVFTPKY